MSNQPLIPFPVVNPNPQVCPDCGGLKEPRKKKCECSRKKKRKPDAPTFPSDLTTAHNYALLKFKKSGFGKGGSRWGFVVKPKAEPRSYVIQDNKAIAWFMYRTEMAVLKNRDEFASLMKMRVALRLQRMKDEDACEWLDLSRRELSELDGIIVGEGFLPRLPRSKYDGEIPTRLRKMKRGVAADILRRRQKNYKQGQVLTPQIVSPFAR